MKPEIFFQSIVDNVPAMIFVKDAKDLRFVLFNKAGEDLLGYSREEMIGKTDFDFFPKKEADFFVEKDRLVLAGKVMLDIPEEPIQTRYLGPRILHTRKIPILDANGVPQFLLGISEDITERMRNLDRLKTAYADLESVVELRTKSLEDANASLKQEIESRARTERHLKEQNAELQTLNAAMIGRELKMVELKKELELLKKRLTPA